MQCFQAVCHNILYLGCFQSDMHILHVHVVIVRTCHSYWLCTSCCTQVLICDAEYISGVLLDAEDQDSDLGSEDDSASEGDKDINAAEADLSDEENLMDELADEDEGNDGVATAKKMQKRRDDKALLPTEDK